MLYMIDTNSSAGCADIEYPKAIIIFAWISLMLNETGVYASNTLLHLSSQSFIYVIFLI